MNKYFLTAVSAAVLSMGTVSAQGTVTVNPPAGGIPALGGNPTGAYGATHVETKLNVEIKDGTKAVHFIRDNNDPWVVTKAYLLKNADPLVARGVLRTIVTGSTLKNSPVEVNAVKYVDGSGVLLISAEEYRFKDAGNGMSIDALVAMVDKKNLPNSSGTVDMTYFPKYNKASDLLQMILESGIGETAIDSKGGVDTVNEDYFDTDDELNVLIMSNPGYDITDALNFLKEVDTPAGEIALRYKLVEIYAENDQKLGMDFQSWKNNDGIDLFSAGGKYANNWMGNNLAPNLGHTFTEYYNFNPKWNTKYVDFLTVNGKAKVVSSGTLLVTDGKEAAIEMNDGIFSVVAKEIEQKTVAELLPEPQNIRNGYYANRYQNQLVVTEIENLLRDYFVRTTAVKEDAAPVGNPAGAQETVAQEGNRFSLKISGAIHGKAATLNVGMESASLIGWESNGTPRLAKSAYNTNIQIGKNGKEFIIGGIQKTSVVRSVTGLPLLKDLPVLGWLFSTETDTVKKSQFVLIATAVPVDLNKGLDKADKAQIGNIKAAVKKAEKSPSASTLGFQQLLIDTNEIK